MQHDLTDLEIVQHARKAGLLAQVVRAEDSMELQFDDGSVLLILPNWRGPCRVVFYTPDEANARAQ